eukprot:scaffold13317_cov92-Alexandrium_tamarense.AAC.8
MGRGGIPPVVAPPTPSTMSPSSSSVPSSTSANHLALTTWCVICPAITVAPASILLGRKC